MRLFIPIFIISFLLQADIIKTSKKEIDDIVIRTETYQKISYYYKVDRRKTLQHIPLKARNEVIILIVREEVSNEYEAAERLFAQRQYSSAISLYKRTMSNRDWTEQHCLFKIAECYRQKDNKRAAIKWYSRLLKQFASTIYAPYAYLNMGKIFMSLKRWRYARQVLQRAAAISKGVNHPPFVYKMKTSRQAMKIFQGKPLAIVWLESMYNMGVAYEKQKQLARAAQIYGKVAQYRTKTANSWNQRSKMRLAHCLLKQGKYLQAKKKLLALTKNTATDKDILAGIYMGLGDYYLKQEDVYKALLCYMRVILMYPHGEYVRNARSQAIYCCNLLKNESPEYQQRARQLKELIIE